VRETSDQNNSNELDCSGNETQNKRVFSWRRKMLSDGADLTWADNAFQALECGRHSESPVADFGASHRWYQQRVSVYVQVTLEPNYTAWWQRHVHDRLAEGRVWQLRGWELNPACDYLKSSLPLSDHYAAWMCTSVCGGISGCACDLIPGALQIMLMLIKLSCI